MDSRQEEFCNELVKCLKMFNTRLHECEIEIDLLKAKIEELQGTSEGSVLAIN